MELQKRDTPISYNSVKVTELKGLDQRVVEGYGAVWGSKNGHDEIFIRGAFSKSISDLGPSSNSSYQLKFRDEHGKACALFDEISEDEVGLHFRTKPLDAVPWSDHLLVQLRSKTINNFSIGFKHVYDKMEYDDKQDAIVNREARLFEISAVAIPSDLSTFAVRSEEELEYLQEDVEDFIIELPKSKQLEARKIFTRCMTLTSEKPLDLRDKALNKNEPFETELDYNYLISKL